MHACRPQHEATHVQSTNGTQETVCYGQKQTEVKMHVACTLQAYMCLKAGIRALVRKPRGLESSDHHRAKMGGHAVNLSAWRQHEPQTFINTQIRTWAISRGSATTRFNSSSYFSRCLGVFGAVWKSVNRRFGCAGRFMSE